MGDDVPDRHDRNLPGDPTSAAFVWSFLLLGERFNGWQFVGIAIVLGGPLAFLLMNNRGIRKAVIGRAAPTVTHQRSSQSG
jgi:hypothetical protein